MEIEIYTSKGCVWCNRVKELMTRANQEYVEYVWQNFSGNEQQELMKQYPEMSSFPVVIIDGEYVGGLVETAKKFLNDGLVSPTQKNE